MAAKKEASASAEEEEDIKPEVKAEEEDDLSDEAVRPTRREAIAKAAKEKAEKAKKSKKKKVSLRSRFAVSRH